MICRGLLLGYSEAEGGVVRGGSRGGTALHAVGVCSWGADSVCLGLLVMAYNIA